MMSHADRIRKYSSEHYIEPARSKGESTVRISAGDVHKAIGLRNRVPAVCQALRSNKFLEENGLLLEKWEGPPKGQGTRVVATYRFRESDSRQPKDVPEWPFLRLRGIAKEVFGGLGGGEVFIRKEREQFIPSPDRVGDKL